MLSRGVGDGGTERNGGDVAEGLALHGRNGDQDRTVRDGCRRSIAHTFYFVGVGEFESK
jgi:hypothetical protein